MSIRFYFLVVSLFCAFTLKTFAISLFIFTPKVFATSFTTFSFTQQIENSKYIVLGEMKSNEVRLAVDADQPYTYWEMKVIENFSDEKLSGSIEVRVPGGKINGKGYHVPGSAQFREGERVVLMLRDTGEFAKQVIGLASGKYELAFHSGKEVLKSALGTILRDHEGEYIDLSRFRELASKLLTRDISPEERRIYVNPQKNAGHSHHKHSHHKHSHHKHSHHEHSHHENIPTPAMSINTTQAQTTDTHHVTPHATAYATPHATLKEKSNNSSRSIASQSENQWIGPLIAFSIFLVGACATIFLLRPKE